MTTKRHTGKPHTHAAYRLTEAEVSLFEYVAADDVANNKTQLDLLNYERFLP